MKKKKGFTLVELLVVIAILAVLATVSVVGYMGFTKKAHESNDASLTAQMNTALQANGVVKKNKTLTEAREDLLEAGIDLEKVTPTTDGYSYVWDSKQDLMFLLNENREVVAPTNATISANTVDSFVVVHNETEFNTWKSDYSLYFANGYESQTLTLTKLVGVDAGTSGINNISVKDDSSTADVTMYTTSGTLTIDARQATVRHYGEAKTVSIKAIAGESYHEYGTVTGNVEVTKGRVELESTADVNTVLVSSEASGDSKVDYNSGAKVGTVAPTTDAAKADVSSSTIPSESKQETIVDTTETSKFAGGLGTEKSPYLIETEEQFSNINTGTNGSYYYYKLINDLNVSKNYTIEGANFVANKLVYSYLDGSNFSIKINDNSHLFYQTFHSEIKNLKVDVSSNLVYYANYTNFNNVDLFGKISTSGGNEGIYVIYANPTSLNNTLTFNNCDCYVDFNSDGNEGSYNAVFTGYAYPNSNVKLSYTNCTYNGTFVSGKAAMFLGNNSANQSKVEILISNCENNGIIQSTYTNKQYGWNSYVATGITPNYKDVESKSYLNNKIILNNSTLLPQEINEPMSIRGFISGPNDKSLKLIENNDKTFTLNASENVNVSYYIVSVTLYSKFKEGGTLIQGVQEKIAKESFVNGKYTTKLMNLSFVDLQWTKDNPTATKTIVGDGEFAYTIYELNGEKFYLIPNNDTATLDGKICESKMIGVSCYDVNNNLIASTALTK